MYLIRYEKNQHTFLGFFNDSQEKVLPLSVFPNFSHCTDMNDLIDLFHEDHLSVIEKAFNEKPQDLLNINDVKLLTPIPYSKRNLFCLGKNYLDHVQEMSGITGIDGNTPKAPIFFSKPCYPSIGPDDNVIIDTQVTKAVDYEVELAVIIGKKGKNIPKEDALSYVFGYTISNDYSARDLQTHHTQWHKGKSLDTFTALGPMIIHHTSIGNPADLKIECFVNDEKRQSSNTAHMIFDIPTTIAILSQGLTLYPGDIILTGTPSGVGMGFKPPKFLKEGDKVTCVIEKIGQLTNIVKVIK